MTKKERLGKVVLWIIGIAQPIMLLTYALAGIPPDWWLVLIGANTGIFAAELWHRYDLHRWVHLHPGAVQAMTEAAESYHASNEAFDQIVAETKKEGDQPNERTDQ